MMVCSGENWLLHLQKYSRTGHRSGERVPLLSSGGHLGTWAPCGQPGPGWPAGLGWAAVPCLLWGLSCHAQASQQVRPPGRVPEPSDSPARPSQKVAPSPVTLRVGVGVGMQDPGGCTCHRIPLPKLRPPRGASRLLGIAGSPGDPPSKGVVLASQGHAAYFPPGRPCVPASTAGRLPTVLWFSRR